MKNNGLQDLKPVYIHEIGNAANDEINLIDLAMVLVRRKAMMATVFIIVTTLGIITAFLTPKTYTFSTSLEIGSQIVNGSIEPFESPQTLLAKLQHSFIPKVLSEHQTPNSKEKYRISASIPKNSEIIVLEIKGAIDQASHISKLLKSISEQAIKDHQRIFEAVKQNHSLSKTQAEIELNSLIAKEKSQTEKNITLESKIKTYNFQLANLRNTREILPPMKSVEATSISRKLIIIITVLLASLFSITTAFLVEFISIVKERLHQSSR